MGVREWISKTAEAPQQQQAKPSQNETRQNSVEKLPAEVKAQAVEAARPSARIIDGAAQARESQTHGGQADGREALIRNQGNQGREQSAMSPTDHSRSQTPNQARSMQRGRGIER